MDNSDHHRQTRRRLAILCSHLRHNSTGNDSVLFSSVCVSDPSSNEQQEKDCVFCGVVRGESPAFKLYEDESCLCILDSYPLSDGRSLIIPKSHYSSLEATPPSVIAAMFAKVPLISGVIMKATACDSFNLLVNNGAAAGQVIFHVSCIQMKAPSLTNQRYVCLGTRVSLNY